MSLVFFFSPDVNSALIYLSKLTKFGGTMNLLGPLSLSPVQVIIYILIFLCLDLIKNDYSDIGGRLEYFWREDTKKARLCRWVVYSTIITILFVVGNKDGQFIYVNF